MTTEQVGWYFTAPWDPVPSRRGDPLGLRAGAEYFANLLAPGLSNATADARWISLLSWSLHWSNIAWQRSGGRDLSTRDGLRARYAWLRPLELLWVDRTLEAGQATGQLRGRRSVKRWRDDGRKAPNFAMSTDQFSRYRQIGMYGAYRVLLRREAALTSDNGWTPGPVGVKLADIVNRGLPSAARLAEEDFEAGIKWGHWVGKEAEYWVRFGWHHATERPDKGTHPSADHEIGASLPENERHLLEPVLFPADSTRRRTAQLLAKATGARSHTELCDALAAAGHCGGRLAPLPAFTRFADAAMHATRLLWAAAHQDATTSTPAIAQLARAGELSDGFDAARQAAAIWLETPSRSDFPHTDVVTRLARSLTANMGTADHVSALVRHHHEHGGGRRWFREAEGKLIPLLPDSSTPASDYRFRLVALTRLASQCGVARMDAALAALGSTATDEEDSL